MRRFKTREELRQTGWTFEKDITGEYVFQNNKSTACISTTMFKNVHGLSEESCRRDFPQYVYTDEMFTIPSTMIEKVPMLRNILGKEEYYKFLKAKALEEFLNEDYVEVKKIIDELLETTY